MHDSLPCFGHESDVTESSYCCLRIDTTCVNIKDTLLKCWKNVPFKCKINLWVKVFDTPHIKLAL